MDWHDNTTCCFWIQFLIMKFQQIWFSLNIYLFPASPSWSQGLLWHWTTIWPPWMLNTTSCPSAWLLGSVMAMIRSGFSEWANNQPDTTRNKPQYNIRMFFVPKLIVSDFDLLSYLDNPIKIPGGLMSQRSWWKRRPLCPLVTVTPGVISNGRFLPNVQWIEIYTYAHLHAHMHDMPIIFACIYIYIDESFREMFRHACIRILGAPKWPKTKPRFGRVLKVHWRQNAWWMMCL